MKRKIAYHEHDTPNLDQLPITSDVASAQECTGLMHKSPTSLGELESYQQLFSMAIPPKQGQEQEKAGYQSGKSKRSDTQ